MELKDFVSQSILQIVNGVKIAQDKNNTNARINPSGLRLGSNIEQSNLFDFEQNMLLSTVEFDVSVSAEKSKGTKGGISVLVGAVGLGSQGQSGKKDQFINRLKFSVPISLPKGS